MAQNLEKRTNFKRRLLRTAGSFFGAISSLGYLSLTTCGPEQDIHVSLPGISVNYNNGDLDVEVDRGVDYGLDGNDNYTIESHVFEGWRWHDDDDDGWFSDWFDDDCDDWDCDDVVYEYRQGDLVNWPTYLPQEKSYSK